MADLLAAVGLMLVLEGLLYAAVPGKMKQFMAQTIGTSDDALRIAGVVALASGVGLVWIVRAG